MLKINKYKISVPVYDVTVAESPNFFANDILIHNCTEINIQTKSSEYDEKGNKTETGSTGVCQLSSINLPQHIENGKINWDRLERTIKLLVRSVDNAININFYPTEETKSHLLLRPIGIGEMGFQDVCLALNIIYDSDEGAELARKIQEFVSYHCILTSSELAKEKGQYSTYKGSLWDKGILPHDSYFSSSKERGLEPIIKQKDSEALDWDKVRKSVKENGVRNMLVQAIAPTASISYIAGCEQSIEPNYSVIYVYKNLSGNNYVINAFEYFKKDMVKENLWNVNLVKALNFNDGDVSKLEIPEFYKRKYANAFNRDMHKLIKCAAMRQIYIDQSQSFNIWYSGDSLKEVNDIYFKCWESGLKSTYYFRNLRKDSVKKTVNEEKKEEIKEGAVCTMEEGCISCQ